MTAGGLIVAAVAWLSGGVNFQSLDPPEASTKRNADRKPAVTPAINAVSATNPGFANEPAPGDPPAETVRIATFNIKQFGPKKSSDPAVLRHIADLIADHDVVAIQEVRGEDGESIGRLIDHLNHHGGQFAATVSERIGTSTRYREAYAFVWNRVTIERVPGTDFVIEDPEQRMARQPMTCSFRCRADDRQQRRPFSFTLINVHTSPSQVTASATLNEMDVLDDVYRSVRQYVGETLGEDDVVLLGDLNVDEHHLRQLGQIAHLESVHGGEPTNVLGDKTYDHIVIDRVTTGEFVGRAGVIDMAERLAIDAQQAAAISDHQPVWAEFSRFEDEPIVASRTVLVR